MHFVYVIRNAVGRLYVGCTSDVARRLLDHNAGISKWTRSRGPWALVWQKPFSSLGEARKHENLLKRQKGGDGFYNLTGIGKPGPGS
ncbi:MAG: GIY-YIG nuclease family protein [Kiritimatiellia bacterium]